MSCRRRLLVDRVERELRVRVTRMALPARLTFPWSVELASQYEVSLKTVRAPSGSQEGRVCYVLCRGKGTFVVPKSRPSTSGRWSSAVPSTTFRLRRHPDRFWMCSRTWHAAAVSRWWNRARPRESLGFAPRDVGGVLALGAEWMPPGWPIGPGRRCRWRSWATSPATCGSPRLCHQVISDSRRVQLPRHAPSAAGRPPPRWLMACWGGDRRLGARSKRRLSGSPG